MEFVTWELLGTYAGAMAMTGVITQLTKGIPGISKIPTQLWSYLIALAVMICANFFLDQLTPSSGVLTMFNAGLVSLAANGGYESVVKLFNKE